MNDIEKVIETLKDMKGVFGNRGHEQYSLLALDLAISALEKQIPKRPIYHEETEEDYEYHECPNCEDIFDASTTLLKYKYCPECGQLLDWRVEE